MWLTNYNGLFHPPFFAPLGCKVWNQGILKMLLGLDPGSTWLEARWHPYSEAEAAAQLPFLGTRRSGPQTAPAACSGQMLWSGGFYKSGMWLWARTRKLTVRLCACQCGCSPSPACSVFLFPSRSRSFCAVNPLGMWLLSPPRRIHYPFALTAPQAPETKEQECDCGELPPELRCAGAGWRSSRLFL